MGVKVVGTNMKHELLNKQDNGGGGEVVVSSYKLLAKKTVDVSTTNTSATTVATFALPETWTYQKMIYVKVCRTEVPEAGNFYGHDTFFALSGVYNGSETAQTTANRALYKVNANKKWGATFGVAYGVYGASIDPDGTVTVSARYSSTYTGTVSGTFDIEVYTLDWPDNETPFVSLE